MATQKAIRRAALAWADKLTTPEQIQAHLPEFEKWLTTSSRHADAYHLAERTRCEAAACGEQLRDWGINEERLLSQLHKRMAPRIERKAMWLALPVTAVSLLIVAAAVSAYLDRIPWLRYITSAGEVRTVTLGDGSIVTLNTNTTLRARVSLVRRELVLERGQALFEVRHEWLRGFFVAVSHAVVRAKGTRFALDRKTDVTFQALVTEGAVKVSSEAGSLDPTRGEIVLAAGQAALVSPSGAQIDSVSATELDHRLAWTKELDFDETLEEAVGEFNHYNVRQFVIDDPQLRGVPVVGHYFANRPDLFSQDLETSHHIEHSLGPDGAIHLSLRPKAPANRGPSRGSTL